MAWKIVETDYENKNFWQEKADFENRVEMMRVINVYPECHYQKIRGFGGAFTESSGYNLITLAAHISTAVISLLGIMLTMRMKRMFLLRNLISDAIKNTSCR